MDLIKQLYLFQFCFSVLLKYFYRNLISLSKLKVFVLFNVSGLLPLSSACEPLAVLVPVPGDVHVFCVCRWEGDISLGR